MRASHILVYILFSMMHDLVSPCVSPRVSMVLFLFPKTFAHQVEWQIKSTRSPAMGVSCPVCFEDTPLATCLPCQHRICAACIDRPLARRCYLCRRPVTSATDSCGEIILKEMSEDEARELAQEAHRQAAAEDVNLNVAFPVPFFGGQMETEAADMDAHLATVAHIRNLPRNMLRIMPYAI